MLIRAHAPQKCELRAVTILYIFVGAVHLCNTVERIFYCRLQESKDGSCVKIFIKAVVFCPSCSIGRGRRGGSLQSGLLGSAGPGASLSRGQRTSNRIKFLPGTAAQGASQGTGPGTGQAAA